MRRRFSKKTLISWLVFDGTNAIWIKSEMIPDWFNGGVGCLIGPHGVACAVAAEGNAEIRAIALIGAVCCVVRACQERHIHVFAWNVLDRPVMRLREGQGVARIRDDPPGDRDDDPVRIAFYGYGVIGAGYLDWSRG